jgi:Amt family ammonium transporter
MQAGFAMVGNRIHTSQERGHIIMKNLMDFAIGTVAFG